MLDQMDRWTDGLPNGCMDGLVYPHIWVLIRIVRHVCNV